MCRAEGADPAEVYRSAYQRARKPHACNECGRSIEPGESYQYIFMVYDSVGCTFRVCEHCCVGVNWLIENCGGWVCEQVREELDEHAEEYPDLAGPLQQFAADMLRGWKLPGGRLMPLPEQPPGIAA